MDIKALREELNLTQKEMARQLGLPFRTFQDWESGKTRLTERKLKKLRDFRDNYGKTAQSSDIVNDLLSNLKGEKDHVIKLLRTIASNKSVLTVHDCEKVVSYIQRHWNKLEDQVTLIHDPEKMGVPPEPKNVLDYIKQFWKGDR